MNHLKTKVEDTLQRFKTLFKDLRAKWQAHREALSPDEQKQENSNIVTCIVGVVILLGALHAFYLRVQYDRSGAITSSPSEDEETKFWRDTVKELKRDKLNPFTKDP